MPNPYEGQLDKIWFLFVFLVATFVAAKPEAFVRVITLGRYTSADVSHVMLRTTQIIAGFTALALLITFIVSLFTKAR